MLYTLVGQTGSGKSLYTNYLAYRECSWIKNNGKKIKWYDLRSYQSYYDYVVLNTDFDDGRGNFTKYDSYTKTWDYGGYCIGITDLPELYDINQTSDRLKLLFIDGCLRNCLVLLDEGGTQFATTDWDKMPEGYKLFLTSHRHNVTGFNRRFDIYISTQHKDLIEVTLRRISNRIFLIRPLFGFAQNPSRPSLLSTMSAVKIWTYWRHEVLESRPIVVGSDNLPQQDQLEGLVYYDWLYIGKKYRDVYNSIGRVQDMKREKKEKK